MPSVHRKGTESGLTRLKTNFVKEAISKLGLRSRNWLREKRWGPEETGKTKAQHVQKALHVLGSKNVPATFELLRDHRVETPRWRSVVWIWISGEWAGLGQ